MTMSAVVMMIIAIATLWGGLVAAAVNLFRRPDLSAADDGEPPTVP
ncbi:methionine/alanine import family NSS transporter small subunit [Arachnia propionica]|uniref:Methionine/alanine import family NSS transporter small subunit n=1 Tax=Arachnia propionica TaxID=1750 RepID=A0A3P1T5B5_9ACTN|nr:methionine/alanine import family NSS transporter small subunit [Arachnia propionica]MDO5083890.1 methionine/alanine import family NSS transporter small subunit [Arachnia propionica]RRD04661.1 methionine/alanine import family NSS transporter small subunit [Arachnia propionica]